MKWRSPTVLTATGVAVTLILALVVVLTLGLTGGATAVSTNAALIGALVALGGVFTAQMVSIALDDRSSQEARDLEAQRAREAALQNYFEQVGKLLIEQPLRRASPGDSLSTVVRAQTLTVLEGLDPDRKRILLRFLYESGLIAKDTPVVDLREANLQEANLQEANLNWAYLAGADLLAADLRLAFLAGANLGGGTDLRRADLSGAQLTGADLNGADLSGANLRGADLRRADLSMADLCYANLEGGDLTNADLKGAVLGGATLTGANLTGAKYLPQEQINSAIGDERTKLSSDYGLKRPEHWTLGRAPWWRRIFGA